jgi:CDP-glycerol glycerophosphotransferase (TagB/SpsB family)
MDSLNSRAFTEDYRNLKILSASAWLSLGVDLYAALGQSSALISDVSSVLIDYLITEKPIGITGASIKAYQRGLMGDVTALTSGLPSLNTTADLLAFVGNTAAFNWRGAELSMFYDENLRDAESTKRLTEKVLEQLEGENW